jgi:hypothetical protein
VFHTTRTKGENYSPEPLKVESPDLINNGDLEVEEYEELDNDDSKAI